MALDTYRIELPNGMGESMAWGIPGLDDLYPHALLVKWAESWSYGHRKPIEGEVVMHGPNGSVYRAHIKTKRDWVATVTPIEG